MSQDTPNPTQDRRGFLQRAAQGLGLFFLGGVGGKLVSDTLSEEMVWQVNPDKCVYCDKCATECVLTPSASKAVQQYSICGYCRLCTGYFPTDAPALHEGAENQICPVGAIKRVYIEEPYYEYSIDRNLCIGCARCVKGCTLYGNGSFFMQIQRDLCLNCNQCAIALVCDGKAISRVPAGTQYLAKGSWRA
ncbi:MAG: ferredoxin [Candidatus Omnitrophica bacterium]|nr:ferredoxin [Candidatus Omnitrophota bacterium]